MFYIKRRLMIYAIRTEKSFLNLVILTEIRLYWIFYDRFKIKRKSVSFKINRKMVHLILFIRIEHSVDFERINFPLGSKSIVKWCIQSDFGKINQIQKWYLCAHCIYLQPCVVWCRTSFFLCCKKKNAWSIWRSSTFKCHNRITMQW